MNLDLTLKLTENHPALKMYTDTVHEYIRLGHFSTHIDTHLKSMVPLEYMHRRGVLIDVSHTNKLDIEMEDVDLSSVQANDFVIFKTDMLKKYCYGSKNYFTKHVQLSNDIIDALISKKISLIGIDAAGVRRGVEHKIADIRCEEKQIYIIENLDHLDELQKHTADHFTVITLWIEIPGQTGLPCRVVGIV